MPDAPQGYVCCRAEGPITVDGRLDKPVWQAAPWTADFVDIEGDVRPGPRFRTRAKMLWDDDYFYVAAELEEPHVWATLTEHDSVIFQDNDFEIFIDPDGDNHEYYEIEINALNTVWDLRLVKPYRDGGPALNSWEIPGLKSAIHIDGTLNDPGDADRGWSVEIAFPWKVLAEYANRPTPPEEGDQWRVNFSRVEWDIEIVEASYRKIPNRPEHNWVWSPQGVVDMHRPEAWGYVQFSKAPAGQASFRPDPSAQARDLSMRIYHAQRDYQRQHGHWAASVAELPLRSSANDDLWSSAIMQLTEQGFAASVPYRLPDGGIGRIQVSEDSRLQTL